MSSPKQKTPTRIVPLLADEAIEAINATFVGKVFKAKDGGDEDFEFGEVEITKITLKDEYKLDVFGAGWVRKRTYMVYALCSLSDIQLFCEGSFSVERQPTDRGVTVVGSLDGWWGDGDTTDLNEVDDRSYGCMMALISPLFYDPSHLMLHYLYPEERAKGVELAAQEATNE